MPSNNLPLEGVSPIPEQKREASHPEMEEITSSHVLSSPSDLYGDEVDAALDKTTAHQEAREQHSKTLAGFLSPKDRKEWLESSKYLSTRELLGFKEKHLKDFMKWSKVMKAQMKKNMPDGTETHTPLVEAAKIGSLKRGWYQNAAKMIGSLFDQGDDAQRFTGVLAATSPNTPVHGNLRLALELWGSWNEAGRPKGKDIKPFLRKVYDEKFPIGVPGRGAISPFNSWANNVSRVLTWDGSWNQLPLSGHKVNSFYHNLRGHLDKSTNDTHMADFFDLKAKGDPFSKRGGYAAYNALSRKALDVLNQTATKPWTLAELQETVWSAFRTLKKIQGKEMARKGLGRVNEDPEASKAAVNQLLHSGDIHDTVDFVSLVKNDPGILKQLERLGLSKKSRGFFRENPRLSEEGSKKTPAGEGNSSNPILEAISRLARRYATSNLYRPHQKSSKGPRIKFSAHIEETLCYLQE